MPPLPFSPEALLLTGLALLAAALLGGIGWRQRARAQRAERKTHQLRAALQALQERQARQDTPPAPAPDAHAELYGSLVAAMPGAAYRCTADDQWSVVFISDAISALSGWEPANYYASFSLLRDFAHVDDRPRIYREVDAALAQGKSYTVEYRAQHRDGHSFWVREHGHGVRNAKGELRWLDGVIFDIQERKDLEAAWHQAQDEAAAAAAARTALLANVGHEIRTPLNAIIGFSEIVLKTSLDALQREHVYKVRQAAHTLLKLVNDVMDVAKLDRGTLSLDLAAFSLRALAHEALQAQRATADKKGLVLHLDAPDALPEQFEGDAARLRQALDKLLDNAVKFTEQGTVRLQLARQHGQVLLAVHDTGIGIAAQDQARVFDAFSQADGSASRRFGGTGLGISLARQLVQRMGGTLTLQSTPGQGSVFRVLVPLQEGAGPGAAQAADGTPSAPSHEAPLPAGLQALFDAPHPDEQPWHDSLRAAAAALRNGEQDEADLPVLLQRLRGQGLAQHAAQVEQALARFDLDRAAELLEALPARR